MEDSISTILREQGVQTVHDQVVSEVAQCWAKAFQCKVTIKTGLEQNLWADPKQLSGIVGWHFSSRGNSMEWIAEVETEDSLSDPDTRARWKQAVVSGVPMYVLIPRGNKVVVEKLAAAADIQFTSIYEYTFFKWGRSGPVMSVATRVVSTRWSLGWLSKLVRSSGSCNEFS